MTTPSFHYSDLPPEVAATLRKNNSKGGRNGKKKDKTKAGVISAIKRNAKVRKRLEKKAVQLGIPIDETQPNHNP